MAENEARPPLQRDKPREAVVIGNYSKIPNKFFGSGTAARLGSSAALLFLALCEHANRNANMSFKASDASLAADTGMGTRTISQARQRLVEFELVSCERRDGQSYTYTLTKYDFQWKAVKERPRTKCKPRALHASRMSTANFASAAVA